MSLQAILDAAVEGGEAVDVMALADALSDAPPDQRTSLLAGVVARLRHVYAVIELGIYRHRVAVFSTERLARETATLMQVDSDHHHDFEVVRLRVDDPGPAVTASGWEVGRSARMPREERVCLVGWSAGAVTVQEGGA